jgi:iron complex transport system permease protein
MPDQAIARKPDWIRVKAPGSPQYAATRAIVVDLRLPRVLLAVLVGATLAMSGALLQTATRNDLADPFLFGLYSFRQTHHLLRQY